MKRIVLFLVLGILAPLGLIAQTKIDTLYYDKDGRGVEDKIFASYYRVTAVASDPTYPKKCWAYYITGELLGESDFISVDKTNDANTVLDGEYTMYYKSGNVSEHGYKENGIPNGECYSLDENGDVLFRATYKNGVLDGPCLEFVEDKQVYIQTEYDNGSYANDYYIVSTKDGYYSRFRLSDDGPLYDIPSVDDKITEYVDAVEWQYYNLNGIMLALSTSNIKYYGKYVQLEVSMINSSLLPINFSTENITAKFTDESGFSKAMEVVSYDEFMKKVKRVTTFDKVAAGINAGAQAINAGMSSSSTSTSTTTVTGSGYRGTATTTTRTYDSSYAEEKGREAGEQMAISFLAADMQKESFDAEYLKKTTLYPGDEIAGKVNIKFEGEGSVVVYVTIGTAVYEFAFTIDSKKAKKNYTWD